jgi:hypothetical protein
MLFLVLECVARRAWGYRCAESAPEIDPEIAPGARERRASRVGLPVRREFNPRECPRDCLRDCPRDCPRLVRRECNARDLGMMERHASAHHGASPSPQVREDENLRHDGAAADAA